MNIFRHVCMYVGMYTSRIFTMQVICMRTYKTLSDNSSTFFLDLPNNSHNKPDLSTSWKYFMYIYSDFEINYFEKKILFF